MVGGRGRIWMRKRELIADAGGPVRKLVECECGVGGSAEEWPCRFPGGDVVVLLDVALHCFTSGID